jgi:aminoglycoside phosphotransferase (APT) family kinase protein
VVRARVGGAETRYFCKYSAARDPAFGHRGGVRYEAAVYRDVLSPFAVSAPRLVGSLVRPGVEWLVLEHLDDAERLSERYDQLPTVAAWLGRFHALSDRAPEMGSGLVCYDLDYYRGWAERTLTIAGQLGRWAAWLQDLCDWYLDTAPLLADGPKTLIHGEFTIHNVLITASEVVPVDWESTAVGAGEIDLRCLVDNWPPATVDACTTAYVRARWSDAPPEHFVTRSQVAELYLHLRWLGESPDLTLGPKRIWRFDRLRSMAEELGLHG